MRYAKIDEYEVVNGQLGGMSLYCQGCRWRCPNCFNPETHDFNGGHEWTPEVEDKFIELASRPYIKRISILGGEPLADENLDGVLNLVNRFRLLMPEKTIWLYTGYVFNFYEVYNSDHTEIEVLPKDNNAKNDFKRLEIISKCDVLVDGRYIDTQRNLSKKWCGSDNQRVISVQESLKQNKIILHCD